MPLAPTAFHPHDLNRPSSDVHEPMSMVHPLDTLGGSLGYPGTSSGMSRTGGTVPRPQTLEWGLSV